MRNVLHHLVDALEAKRPTVYCRLVETRGSTPQKAGAAMLVYADGSQTGTLGGGCVEAEVKRHALAKLDGGAAEVVSFQLDSDYGWDDGLICGGRMQILVQPVQGEASGDYFRRYLQTIEQAQGCCEAIVFDAEKSGHPSPACYLFDADGELLARELLAEEGPAPASVTERLPSFAERPKVRAEHGVAYLPILPRRRLLIVGGGHIGQAVGNWASDLDFDVWVVDDRQEYVSRARFPRAERLICGDIGQTLKELEITPDTYCIIVTRGHNHDEEALYHLVDRGACYVGMIGSRRKIKLIFDDLEAEGVSAESLAKVYAPLGVDIGSQTVPEIAVSILAELIAHRNGRETRLQVPDAGLQA